MPTLEIIIGALSVATAMAKLATTLIDLTVAVRGRRMRHKRRRAKGRKRAR